MNNDIASLFCCTSLSKILKIFLNLWSKTYSAVSLAENVAYVLPLSNCKFPNFPLFADHQIFF